MKWSAVSRIGTPVVVANSRTLADRCRHADDERRGGPAEVELVADGGDHDLDHADQRGQPCHHERSEEQHADQGSGRSLGDDRRERDEGQAEARGRHLVDGDPVGLGHEPQRGEHPNPGKQLEG